MIVADMANKEAPYAIVSQPNKAGKTNFKHP